MKKDVAPPRGRRAADGRKLNEPLALALLRARAAGICAEDIARAAGISPSKLSRVMHNRQAPSREVAERIAGALSMPAEELFPGGVLRSR
jgi:transcriptional regulator with XRE-family HTH domain